MLIKEENIMYGFYKFLIQKHIPDSLKLIYYKHRIYIFVF